MKEIILKKMKEKRLKLTPQRMAIVEAFVEQTPFIPAPGLFIRKQRRNIGA